MVSKNAFREEVWEAVWAKKRNFNLYSVESDINSQSRLPTTNFWLSGQVDFTAYFWNLEDQDNFCSSSKMLQRSLRSCQKKDFFQTANQFLHEQQYFCPGFFVDLIRDSKSLSELYGSQAEIINFISSKFVRQRANLIQYIWSLYYEERLTRGGGGRGYLPCLHAEVWMLCFWV